jgi:hypothetical protein
VQWRDGNELPTSSIHSQVIITKISRLIKFACLWPELAHPKKANMSNGTSTGGKSFSQQTSALKKVPRSHFLVNVKTRDWSLVQNLITIIFTSMVPLLMLTIPKLSNHQWSIAQ